MVQSTLDGNPLPLRFRYEPPRPIKRVSVKDIAGGIVIQQAPVLYVEDNIIPWKLDAVPEDIKDFIQAFYDNPISPEIEFVGHNEPTVTYTVRCLHLDKVEPKHAMYYMSGSFQVTGKL